MALCVPWYILTEQAWLSLTNVVGPGTQQGLNVVMDRFRKDSSLTDEAPQLELFKLWKQLDARQDLKDAGLFHRRLMPHDVGFGLCLCQKVWHIMLHGPAGYRVRNDLQYLTNKAFFFLFSDEYQVYGSNLLRLLEYELSADVSDGTKANAKRVASAIIRTCCNLSEAGQTNTFFQVLHMTFRRLLYLGASQLLHSRLLIMQRFCLTHSWMG